MIWIIYCNAKSVTENGGSLSKVNTMFLKVCNGFLKIPFEINHRLIFHIFRQIASKSVIHSVCSDPEFVIKPPLKSTILESRNIDKFKNTKDNRIDQG